jgi:hypothetical protein
MGNQGHIIAKIGSSSKTSARCKITRARRAHSKKPPITCYSSQHSTYTIDLGSCGPCRERAAIARSPDRWRARSAQMAGTCLNARQCASLGRPACCRSAPYLTRWCMASAPWGAFSLTSCRGWLISPSGPALVKQHFGLPALSPAPTRRTADPPPRASS